MALIDQYEVAKQIRQNKDTHEDCQGAIHYNIGCEHSAQIVEQAEPVEFDLNDYHNRANVLLSLWMDNILTDSEYNRIMDRLNNK